MEHLFSNEQKRNSGRDYVMRPQIELIHLEPGQQENIFVDTNEVVFFVEGTVRLTVRGLHESKNTPGDFAFLPCGSEIFVTALSDSVVIVIRFEETIRFCDNYTLEDMYNEPEDEEIVRLTEQWRSVPIGHLRVNEHMQHFMTSLTYYIAGGLKNKQFFELKVQEFLFLLKTYYSKDELRNFFRLILSSDTSFSEHVRKNWRKYPNVKDLAGSFGMSTKQFTRKFKQVFGQTTYQWIKNARARAIHDELVFTDKPLKQVAMDNGFSLLPQFTNFCKKELGANPSTIRKQFKDTFS